MPGFVEVRGIKHALRLHIKPTPITLTGETSGIEECFKHVEQTDRQTDKIIFVFVEVRSVKYTLYVQINSTPAYFTFFHIVLET